MGDVRGAGFRMQPIGAPYFSMLRVARRRRLPPRVTRIRKASLAALCVAAGWLSNSKEWSSKLSKHGGLARPAPRQPARRALATWQGGYTLAHRPLAATALSDTMYSSPLAWESWQECWPSLEVFLSGSLRGQEEAVQGLARELLWAALDAAWTPLRQRVFALMAPWADFLRRLTARQMLVLAAGAVGLGLADLQAAHRHHSAMWHALEPSWQQALGAPSAQRHSML